MLNSSQSYMRNSKNRTYLFVHIPPALEAFQYSLNLFLVFLQLCLGAEAEKQISLFIKSFLKHDFCTVYDEMWCVWIKASAACIIVHIWSSQNISMFACASSSYIKLQHMHCVSRRFLIGFLTHILHRVLKINIYGLNFAKTFAQKWLNGIQSMRIKASATCLIVKI